MKNHPNSCDILLIHPSKTGAYGQVAEFASTTPDFLLGLVDSYIESKGYVSCVIDLDVTQITQNDLISLISSLQPKLVGVFSTGVNVSASTQTMPAVIEFFDSLAPKIDKNIKTFVYGGHPTVLPERTLDETNANFVIIGEGYETIELLLKSLINNNSFEDIEGLAFKKQDLLGNISYIINKMPKMLDVNDLPMINWEKLNPSIYQAHNWHCFGEDTIENRSPYGVIWTSMGCAYPCDFCCINNLYSKRTFRFRDMQSVVEEIDILVTKHGVKNLRIMDELFIIKHPRITEFCELMEQRNYDLNIWCYARVDSVTPEILKRLKKIGMNWIGYGFETGDDEEALVSINKAVKKGSLSNDEVIKITRDAGINMIGHAILGLYEDDEKAIRRNVDFLRKHEFEWNNIYPAFAYPGTPFYEDYVGKKIIPVPKSWDEYGLYSYECKPLPTKHLSAAEVLKLRDELFIDYYSDDHILNNLRLKFGQKTVDHINQMLSLKIDRRIVEKLA
jgi:anaerobic magnesium-protoporphyrin IX monomethyl ester cyclase